MALKRERLRGAKTQRKAQWRSERVGGKENWKVIAKKRGRETRRMEN